MLFYLYIFFVILSVGLALILGWWSSVLLEMVGGFIALAAVIIALFGQRWSMERDREAARKVGVYIP